MMRERLALVAELWKGGIPAEVIYRDNVKIVSAFQVCEAEHIPFCAILGDTEIASGIVKIRNMATRAETDVPRAELATRLRDLLAALPARPALTATMGRT